MTSTPEELSERGEAYGRYGVEPIINAKGMTTVYGGSIMEPDVAEAMASASRVMVKMAELNDRAGEIIAAQTGAEAGLVSAGATAGMTLQAAACIAGSDPARIEALPDTTGLNDEIVVKWGHNSGFVRAWRAAGATIRWAGGSTGTSDWEIEAEITENTAALGFVASKWHPDSFEGLDRMVAIGDEHDVPVIVDAAEMLPPVENLRRFVDRGADMVVFSGGKALKGPQSTGIVAGREDLIEAARLNNSPNISINRGAKVCREEIVGLLAALERYVERDHDADQRRWREECRTIGAALDEIDGVEWDVLQDDWTRSVPELSVSLDAGWRGPSVSEVKAALEDGTPPIVIGSDRRRGEDLFVHPHGFLDGEAAFVAERLAEALRART